jgi:hypothetical protein
MGYVQCSKTTHLFKIYRYLPFPIPILFKTRAHDLTIKQSLNFLDSRFSKSIYEDLFDQDNLDHKRIQEALFITDTADLIPIDNECNFQVLTQTDPANCVQQNYKYLCDWQHVVQCNLTDTCLGSLYLRMKMEWCNIANLNENQLKKWCIDILYIPHKCKLLLSYAKIRCLK